MIEVEREGEVVRLFLNRPEKANVVVLAGRGKTFCGRADVRELQSLTASSDGAVIGAGLEIAAACDLRIAARGTKFAMPEVRIGIPSVVEAALLPRRMGSGRAAWLVLTGEPIDARRALEWGLVEELGGDAALRRVVKSLLACDPAALRIQKQLIQLWDEAPLATSVAASVERFAAAHGAMPRPGALRGRNPRAARRRAP